MDISNLLRMVIVLALLGAVVLYGSRIGGKLASNV